MREGESQYVEVEELVVGDEDKDEPNSMPFASVEMVRMMDNASSASSGTALPAKAMVRGREKEIRSSLEANSDSFWK